MMGKLKSGMQWLLATGLLATIAAGGFGPQTSRAEDGAVKSGRVYELRTYTTFPGRLDALNVRFRDHTMKLFEKHGIRNEMYWVPLDEKLRENTLVYLISHESEAAAKKSWADFQADPEWKKARDASEADGKIVEKVERVFMKTTDYSPKK
jgi:hypothetical protein